MCMGLETKHLARELQEDCFAREFRLKVVFKRTQVADHYTGTCTEKQCVTSQRTVT